ncbi:hypothetical protein D3C76_1845210 [compost metagenome]
MADADGELAQALQGQYESDAQSLGHFFCENDLERVIDAQLKRHAFLCVVADKL